jgi:hypothetical protein
MAINLENIGTIYKFEELFFDILNNILATRFLEVF